MRPLYMASKYGLIIDVKHPTAWKNVSEINHAIDTCMTPLYMASKFGKVDVVQLLLEKCTDVNHFNNRGQTALHAACYEGHVDVVQLLLDKGAEINNEDKNGETPLYAACIRGHVDIVQLLIDNNANINCLTKAGQRPIDIACEMKHFNIAQKLCVKTPDLVESRNVSSVSAARDRGDSDDRDDSVEPYPNDAWRPLERFDDTLDGALVKIIPDLDEFQRLCEIPAPGANFAVEWNDEMEVMCGRQYTIKAAHINYGCYELSTNINNDSTYVPFNACMFVSRDTSSSIRTRSPST